MKSDYCWINCCHKDGEGRAGQERPPESGPVRATRQPGKRWCHGLHFTDERTEAPRQKPDQRAKFLFRTRSQRAAETLLSFSVPPDFQGHYRSSSKLQLQTGRIHSVVRKIRGNNSASRIRKQPHTKGEARSFLSQGQVQGQCQSGAEGFHLRVRSGYPGEAAATLADPGNAVAGSSKEFLITFHTACGVKKVPGVSMWYFKLPLCWKFTDEIREKKVPFIWILWNRWLLI